LLLSLLWGTGEENRLLICCLSDEFNKPKLSFKYTQLGNLLIGSVNLGMLCIFEGSVVDRSSFGGIEHII
jgi:hypothetical protein